jgi:hypothetical protein
LQAPRECHRAAPVAQLDYEKLAIKCDLGGEGDEQHRAKFDAANP